MSMVKVYEPVIGRYFAIEKLDLQNGIINVNKLRKAKHHKTIRLNEMLRVLGSQPRETHVGDIAVVCETTDLHCIIEYNEKEELCGRLYYDYRI